MGTTLHLQRGLRSNSDPPAALRDDCWRDGARLEGEEHRCRHAVYTVLVRASSDHLLGCYVVYDETQ